MADIEKDPQISSEAVSPPPSAHESISRPDGWIYKRIPFGGKNFGWYASPGIQLIIVSMVCFLCPGMFNALGGMGGGGQVNADASNQANTALYATFAIVGFFAGSITNVLGIKTALSFGGLGYCIYIASFLSYNINQNDGFVIFAGALLGVCAGILWTAQGAIMMSYPAEKDKGRFISWFWIIFNLGAVIGSLIPLGQNINAKGNTNVTNGTYVGFFVLTFLGGILAWTLVNSKDVIRHDGSRVIIMKNPSWKTELLGLFETFKTDTWIILMFPMFWASNWFYTYQFQDVNLAYFDTRTRALNSTLYWTSQIIGASVFGYCLDAPFLSRPVKARIAWFVLFAITMGIWGGGYAFQRQYTRGSVGDGLFVKWDWTTTGYLGPMFLYMFYGFFDASWQTCVYWFMGSMTNNGRKLANFAGYYKGIQSAGSAVIYALDYDKVAYMRLFISCWVLLAGSLVVALPIVVFKIKDHVPVEEDLKFSDETYEEVAAQRVE